MNKYLIKGTYTAAGTKALMQEGGSKRKVAIDKMMTSLGGKVESFYFSTGENDIYVIVELPDEVSGAAASLAVNATGLVKITSSPLLSIKDMDAACKKSVSYRAPGQK